MTKIQTSIRNLAHLGDAVYELYIREITITETENPKKLHKMTVALVNAEFQALLLDKVEPELDDSEKDIIRRARNLSVTTGRRVNQKLHRLATALESLIGFLYLTDKTRLDELYKTIEPEVYLVINKFKANAD